MELRGWGCDTRHPPPVTASDIKHEIHSNPKTINYLRAYDVWRKREVSSTTRNIFSTIISTGIFRCFYTYIENILKNICFDTYIYKLEVEKSDFILIVRVYIFTYIYIMKTEDEEVHIYITFLS